jgi:hypothetical protein
MVTVKLLSDVTPSTAARRVTVIAGPALAINVPPTEVLPEVVVTPDIETKAGGLEL